MKQFAVIIFVSLFTTSLFSQTSELQVYSGEKKSFTLFVDGLKENDAPKWKVKVKNLPAGPHHVRVLFDNGQTNTIQKKINVPASSVLTFEILLYENAGRKWYDLTQVDSIIKEKIPEPEPIDSSVVIELKKAEKKADSLLKVSVPEPKIAEPKGVDSLAVIPKPSVNDTIVTTKAESKFQCTNPLLPVGFGLVMEQLKSESYEDLLLDKAKKLADENCFSAIQIMEIMQLMEFEVSRIEFAIYTYPKCFDPMNYKFVEDAFEYDSSKEKLNEALFAKPGKKSAIK